jgi:hypothetical protein
MSHGTEHIQVLVVRKTDTTQIKMERKIAFGMGNLNREGFNSYDIPHEVAEIILRSM